MTRLFERAEEAAIAVLLGAMTLLTFAQVVLRYVFNSGFTWAVEATGYGFAWMVLLGMSYGIRVGSHIGVDVFVQKLSPLGRRAVGIATAGLCLVYATILLLGSLRYVDTMMTLGIDAEDIPVPKWMLLAVLPVGFLLLFIRLAALAWRILRGRQDGFHLADEAREMVEFFDAEERRQADGPAKAGRP